MFVHMYVALLMHMWVRAIARVVRVMLYESSFHAFAFTCSSFSIFPFSCVPRALLCRLFFFRAWRMTSGAATCCIPTARCSTRNSSSRAHTGPGLPFQRTSARRRWSCSVPCMRRPEFDASRSRAPSSCSRTPPPRWSRIAGLTFRVWKRDVQLGHLVDTTGLPQDGVGAVRALPAEARVRCFAFKSPKFLLKNASSAMVANRRLDFQSLEARCSTRTPCRTHLRGRPRVLDSPPDGYSVIQALMAQMRSLPTDAWQTDVLDVLTQVEPYVPLFKC
jgi:hypothetical protein